jgi:hypothetical protein
MDLSSYVLPLKRRHASVCVSYSASNRFIASANLTVSKLQDEACWFCWSRYRAL